MDRFFSNQVAKDQARYIINNNTCDPLLQASVGNDVVKFLSTKDATTSH